jgi:hypothetical protein
MSSRDKDKDSEVQSSIDNGTATYDYMTQHRGTYDLSVKFSEIGP